MKIHQELWTKEDGWELIPDTNTNVSPQLCLVFGARSLLENERLTQELTKRFSDAVILFASTSGEIIEEEVYDDTLTLTAIQFESTQLETHEINISDYDNSFVAGEELSRKFSKEQLSHLFVISDGQLVNGSELVQGLTKNLPENVAVTGGLAGDAAKFEKTLVGFNTPRSGNISAIGLYGNTIKVGYGSMGGWDSFGPERLITKSKNNVLYELDGKSALDLYKEYLGEQAKGLPGTGLLFPLSIKLKENDTPIVRTILAIDEESKSLTFAGDIPEGAKAQLMKANFDRLIDGASTAANRSSINNDNAELAILISCVGRKLVLGQRIDEEVESVRDVLGDQVIFTGFYSYGEISPFTPSAKCELHNQTMTITTFSEH